MTKTISHCPWATKPLDIAYHDAEWGVPVHDDRVRFEFLTLEGAQAGLSWSTVLARRENYQRAFADWDVKAIARFTPARVEKLVVDPGIIRHRGKIESTITNAQAFLRVQKEFGSFDEWVWQFVGGAPRDNTRKAMGELPARTPESDALSKALMKQGFKFVGSTICYAYMQATGMVNDHLVSCPRHREVARLAP
jgi:DNA-3-methyladenine glycosylase I